LRKSKTWLWITLIVVALGSFLWLRGMYGTARTVITTRPDPTPETKLFPSPQAQLRRFSP
jgi:hypothetical protein